MPDNANEDPKDLRTQLNRALRERDEARGELRTERTQRLVAEANLGHLTEPQRTALTTHIGDDDLDLKAVQKAADALGYKPQAPAPNGAPNGVPNGVPPMPQGQVPGQPPQVPGQPPVVTDPNNPMTTTVPPGFMPPNPYQQFVPQGTPMTDPNTGLPLDPVTGQPVYPNMMPNAMPQPIYPGQLPTAPPNPYQPQYPVAVPSPQTWNGQPQWNPGAEQAMNGMYTAEQMQQFAARQAQTGVAAYNQAMAQAQTPEQAMEVVRRFGPSMGIVDADTLE